MSTHDYLKQLADNSNEAVKLLEKSIKGFDGFLLTATNGLPAEDQNKINEIRGMLKNGLDMAKTDDLAGLQTILKNIKNVSKNNKQDL